MPRRLSQLQKALYSLERGLESIRFVDDSCYGVDASLANTQVRGHVTDTAEGATRPPCMTLEDKCKQRRRERFCACDALCSNGGEKVPITGKGTKLNGTVFERGKFLMSNYSSILLCLDGISTSR